MGYNVYLFYIAYCFPTGEIPFIISPVDNRLQTGREGKSPQWEQQ